jgi:hypothetical protein
MRLLFRIRFWWVGKDFFSAQRKNKCPQRRFNPKASYQGTALAGPLLHSQNHGL